MCSSLDVVIALAKKRTCYLLAPFVKTSNQPTEFCHANGKKIIATRTSDVVKWKLLFFAKCAKVTLKKCKNAKIVIINHTDTKWYGSMFVDSSSIMNASSLHSSIYAISNQICLGSAMQGYVSLFWQHELWIVTWLPMWSKIFQKLGVVIQKWSNLHREKCGQSNNFRLSEFH